MADEVGMSNDSTRAEDTDILDRLRFHAERMPGAGLTAHLFTLAHDEIGQLRATLRYLIDYGMGEDEHPYRVARKALGDE